MKAIMFHGVGHPLTVEELPVPSPAKDQLLLKVIHCGICGSDLHGTAAGGIYDEGTVLGHEFVGEIVAIGEDTITDYQIGERVTAFPAFSCGECEFCLRGDPYGCHQLEIIGATNQRRGAFAEYIVVDARMAVKIPAGLPNDVAALTEPLATGLRAFNRGKSALQNRGMLVIGAGPIGLSIALWGKHAGISSVVIADLSESRLALAKKMGVDTIHASRDSDSVAAYTARVGESPAVVYEAVGISAVTQHLIATVAPQTRLVLAGAGMKPFQLDSITAVMKELELVFMLGYSLNEFKAVVESLAQGEINPSPMITRHVGFEQLPDVFESLRKPDDSCKVLFTPGFNAPS